MLTGKMVRVRYSKDRILPCYIDTTQEEHLQLAEQILDLFRSMQGRTRGELEELLEETFGDEANTLLHQGLAKLLEDGCEFETLSGQPPDKVRQVVFRTATAYRTAEASEYAAQTFDRNRVLESAARELGLSVEEVERHLFADLKSEQKLIRFKEPTPEQLLQRYNVALAQAVLLRAVRLTIRIHKEPPQRYRQLLRHIKFRRLICEMQREGPDTYTLLLDGPLSLFSATNKYGLQLALFLPAVLLCKHFELTAELRWGAERKPKTFTLSNKQGLVSQTPDHGMYVPAELQLFVDLFRKRIDDWELHEETEVRELGNGFWVPDFRLVHRATGKEVLLEVLGFWRRSSAIKHLQWLQRYVKEPFLLAVSEQLHIEERLEELPAGLHRFRNMPLADEIARLAREAVGL